MINKLAVEFLNDAIKHLQSQSYSDSGRGLSFQQWFKTLENSIEKLREAKSRVPHVKTPIEKATTVFDVVDATNDVAESVGTLVVIDMQRLEREVLIGSIADADVQKLLPFANVIGDGENFRHIINKSAYVVETNSHVIAENETLCKRAGKTWETYYGSDAVSVATCPGCLAKGKAVIVNHLLKTL
jgi:hypothetical protein